MSFVQLRSQTLQLEKQTEAQLGRLLATLTAEDESVVQGLLDKRADLISRLQALNEIAKQDQVERHRDTLGEHMRLFAKLRARYAEERNRNDLLRSVQSDISQHKQREQSGNDYILDERVRVDSANSFAERLLQLALETRDELMEQRHRLGNAQLRMMGTLQTIPGLNVLILRINLRRRRDTVILALVIALCILVLFFV